MRRKFNFDLFRLNIVDIEDLFLEERSPLIRGDADILRAIEGACSSEFDNEQEARNAKYKWSLRYFNDYSSTCQSRRMISVVLARSVLEKDGLIVTEDGISAGSSASYPPLASTMMLFFDMNRHLVAAEHSGELSQVSWKDHLEKILDDVSLSQGKASTIRLEPVPEKHEIIGLFNSFDRITRIKQRLEFLILSLLVIPRACMTTYVQVMSVSTLKI